jgi:single-stranded DNA-binding protein
MALDVAGYGFLAASADSRTSKAGKRWVRLRVGVGKGEDLQWVSVLVFGEAVEHAADLRKGDRIYFEGRLRLDTWKGHDGIERHGLSVMATMVERTHQIGRNRRAGGYEHESDDSPVEESPPLHDSIPY